MHASSSASPSRRALRTVLGAAALAAAACAGARVHLPEPTEALAAHVPGTSVAELGEGRRLFVGRCSGCHNLPDPKAYRADEWPAQVSEMGARARLSAEQQQLVAHYLQAAALDVPAPAPASQPTAAR
ncbi:hypothetical protein FGE12_28945 [Aggregicoccus sp. 17bor-14]|uniref:hypothetical protein n=1 Tax=Myxococcaceae TaxID=31 RepID=UPI00129C96B0|nr:MULTISPECIES: hypothetical protein [Myxococcaceae]MBF5046476.1 hypothetical protein [Simulacricoccus sp. 17bor-14]MRI92193.1 hypothetical protein [Aggregicoccus sp. 17bor-14]